MAPLDAASPEGGGITELPHQWISSHWDFVVSDEQQAKRQALLGRCGCIEHVSAQLAQFYLFIPYTLLHLWRCGPAADRQQVMDAHGNDEHSRVCACRGNNQVSEHSRPMTPQTKRRRKATGTSSNKERGLGYFGVLVGTCSTTRDSREALHAPRQPEQPQYATQRSLLGRTGKGLGGMRTCACLSGGRHSRSTPCKKKT